MKNKAHHNAHRGNLSAKMPRNNIVSGNPTIYELEVPAENLDGEHGGAVSGDGMDTILTALGFAKRDAEV